MNRPYVPENSISGAEIKSRLRKCFNRLAHATISDTDN
ncbi:hypothetical protein QFZ51_005300 [Chitinophaga sp. W3I9]